MNSSQATSHQTLREEDDEEITLGELFVAVWDRRFMIAGITFVAAAVSVAVSFVLPVTYESSVVLAPISDDADSGKFGGVSSLVSQFGGLSALGGINFSTSSRKAEAVATLQSRTLTETYLAEKNLLPILYARAWDSENHRWKSDDRRKQPTLWKANEYFGKNIRKVTDDKRTGLITMSITWSNPEQAAEWANDLVARTNQYLRQRASEQSNRNIAYLNDQLTRTSVVELQRAIYSLIESEIKKIMIAQGSDEYAFKVIDPAAVPESRVSPNRRLVVITGFFIGLIGSSLAALLLSRRARARTA